MTKVFVKLAKIVARNEHFQRSFYKKCLHFTKAHRQKASQLHVLTDHKQLGCLSCDASKVGCLGLPHSVPWWPVALATRHTLWIRRPRYYNGPNQPATTDIAPAIAQSQRVSGMVRSKRKASHKIFSATSVPHMGAARRQTAPQAPGALSNTPNRAPRMSHTHTPPEIGTLHAPEC